ncbi:hypothetical protein DFS34DRAFT_613779 [Phlyctochytrium arcticum]|nr:hypothetical protein DFS34DRAFT_613779 [Phlyctochytrium arcticum]
MFCTVCNRQFPQHKALRQHLANTPAHFRHTCFLCNRIFSSYGALEMHEQAVHPSRISPCPFCNKNFPSGHEALCMHLTSGGASSRRNEVSCRSG